jgi:hypothetical protein
MAAFASSFEPAAGFVTTYHEARRSAKVTKFRLEIGCCAEMKMPYPAWFEKCCGRRPARHCGYDDSGGVGLRGSWPAHSMTGMRGYLGNLGSFADRSHM